MIDVPASALGQLAYHVATAAQLAVTDRSDDCVPHAVLSWALLEAIGGDRLGGAIDGFDLPNEFGDVAGPAGKHIRERAEELALQLCAHFTSEGQHDVSQLYHDAYGRLTAPG